MVIPFEDMGFTMEPAPKVVKDYFAMVWWVYVAAQILAVVLQVVSMEFLNGAMNAIQAVFAICMVCYSCKFMQQACLLVFLALAVMFAVIGSMELLMDVFGRTSRHDQTGIVNGAQVFVSTVGEHPFFDSKMGWYYNLQSITLIIAPLVSLAGCLLAFVTYRQFSTPLCSDLFTGGGGGSGSGTMGNWGGSTGNNYGTTRSGGGGGNAADRQRWSAGQELGSGATALGGDFGMGGTALGDGATGRAAWEGSAKTPPQVGAGHTLGGSSRGASPGAAGARGNSAQSRLLQQGAPSARDGQGADSV